MFKAFILLILSSLVFSTAAFAQCAMCRATLETNVSNGSQEHLASTLNFGIMYLFVAPYLLVVVVGYIWYKQSRSSSTKK
jgi:hypothetical protein